MTAVYEGRRGAHTLGPALGWLEELRHVAVDKYRLPGLTDEEHRWVMARMSAGKTSLNLAHLLYRLTKAGVDSELCQRAWDFYAEEVGLKKRESKDHTDHGRGTVEAGPDHSDCPGQLMRS